MTDRNRTMLNQMIAVEKGVKAKAQRSLTDAYRDLQKTGPLAGISRVYRPKDEEGDKLPNESTAVQLKAPKIIEEVTKELTRLFDVVLTKEHANTQATADIVVDNEVLLKSVPVTYLLFLEKQLVDLATFVAKLPVLDPSEKWTYDATVGAYRTEPSETVRTKKIPRNHVLSEATDKFPAQVQIFNEDVIVGTWITTKYSGAMTADRVAELAERVDKLKTAVKFAREEANSTFVEDRKAGAALLGYLFK